MLVHEKKQAETQNLANGGDGAKEDSHKLA